MALKISISVESKTLVRSRIPSVPPRASQLSESGAATQRKADLISQVWAGRSNPRPVGFSQRPFNFQVFSPFRCCCAELQRLRAPFKSQLLLKESNWEYWWNSTVSLSRHQSRETFISLWCWDKGRQWWGTGGSPGAAEVRKTLSNDGEFGTRVHGRNCL